MKSLLIILLLGYVSWSWMDIQSSEFVPGFLLPGLFAIASISGLIWLSNRFGSGSSGGGYGGGIGSGGGFGDGGGCGGGDGGGGC